MWRNAPATHCFSRQTSCCWEALDRSGSPVWAGPGGCRGTYLLSSGHKDKPVLPSGRLEASPGLQGLGGQGLRAGSHALSQEAFPAREAAAGFLGPPPRRGRHPLPSTRRSKVVVIVVRSPQREPCHELLACQSHQVANGHESS